MDRHYFEKRTFQKKQRLIILGLIVFCFVEISFASPLYSRQYKISCTACHNAPPQLNIYGTRFRQTNHLHNWESNTSMDTGDENTAIPKIFPFSVRSQMFARLRRAQYISDQKTGDVARKSNIDSQTPYLIKLISSTPLTENVSFYFDVALQPDKNQGVFTLNKAWARYNFDSVFATSITAGQFPTSDIILDQDTRLSVKNYQIYAQSNLGLDQGVRFGIERLNYTFTLGLNNGAEINSAKTANSSGLGRNDSLFDNNNRKTVYGYLTRRFANFQVGLFSQINQQLTPAGALANGRSSRQTFQYTTGLDIQAYPSPRINWVAQFIWNTWREFLNKGKNIQWFGGFVGINYRATDEISYSLLYNYTHAGDFKNTNTLYEGLSTNVITTTVSYYFRSNVRGILEISMDFLPADNDDNFVGHETKEDALIIGIDVSY